MYGNINSGGTGAETLVVLNKTGASVNAGDKVWINKSATSVGSTLATSRGVPCNCAISPDGTKLYTSYYTNSSTTGCLVSDITDLTNITALYTQALYNSDKVDYAYTAAGNLSISFRGNSANRYTLFLKSDGAYFNHRFDSVNGITIYLGDNYWITTKVSSTTAYRYLYTLDENTQTQTTIASGNFSSSYEPISGCYNQSTGRILLDDVNHYSVSGSTISKLTSTTSPGIISGWSTCGINQGQFIIGQTSYAGSFNNPNGTLRCLSWDGTQYGITAYSLASVGLEKWETKHVWHLFNPNTNILTIAEQFGTSYGIYKYDRQRNYFDEVPLLLNTAGNKFWSVISLTDDMSRCAYSFLYPSESSVTTYGSNSKYMVEELNANTKTVIVPYNFSNNYSTTLTGQVITSGVNDAEVKVKTVMPQKVTVNVMADQEDMEIIVR